MILSFGPSTTTPYTPCSPCKSVVVAACSGEVGIPSMNSGVGGIVGVSVGGTVKIGVTTWATSAVAVAVGSSLTGSLSLPQAERSAPGIARTSAAAMKRRSAEGCRIAELVVWVATRLPDCNRFDAPIVRAETGAIRAQRHSFRSGFEVFRSNAAGGA